MKNEDIRGRLLPEILFRVHKRMKLNPNKIYVLKDFGCRRRYTNTLVKLGLIEEVKLVYKTRNNIYKTTKGYKLK